MLDLKRIRFETDTVKDALAKRADPDLASYIDEALQLDEERRRIIQTVEELKARRNEASKVIAERRKAGEDASSLIAEMRDVSASIAEFDAQLGAGSSRIEELLLEIPNTPLPPVPAGDESANHHIRSWGEPLEPTDWRKPHWELGAALGILDLERGAKLSGSGFPVYMGAGAALLRALINLMIDVHRKEHGYVEVHNWR
jgi:seryl-tRNA synthetase